MDGSAWTTGDCSRRVVRGGSWGDEGKYLRAAFRSRNPSEIRIYAQGFRLAGTLRP
jgi:formylglycine-generating enzyme required for sulfatase activity